jgi:hypothetical protein
MCKNLRYWESQENYPTADCDKSERTEECGISELSGHPNDK